MYTVNYPRVTADVYPVYLGWLPAPSAPRQLRISILISCLAVGSGMLLEALIAQFWPEWTFSPRLHSPWIRFSNVIVSTLMIAYGVFARYAPSDWDRLFGLPFATSTLVFATYINITNHTANAAAQLAGVLPVVLVAFHLTLRWSVVIGIMATVGQQLVVWKTLSPVAALNDTIYVPIFLVLLSVMLGLARNEQLRMETALRQQAEIDPLTRVATRPVLDRAIADALAADPHSTALLLVDIDHFKTINDTYGHPVGDRALHVVANCLRDVGGERGLAARIGGDELAVLLRGVTQIEAEQTAHHLVRHVRRLPLHACSDRVRLSVSVGLAIPGLELRGPHRDGVEQLYANADKALYQAKRAGRDQVGLLDRAALVPDQVSATELPSEPLHIKAGTPGPIFNP